MYTRVRRDKSCPDVTNCPSVNVDHDAGRWAIVGKRTALPGSVLLPVALAPEWDTGGRRQGDALLISGAPITDRGELDRLGVADDEAAVTVALAELPALPVTA